MQDHQFYKENRVVRRDKDGEIIKDDKTNPKVSPPVRLVLGRKPAKVDKEKSNIIKKLEEIKQEAAQVRLKAAENLTKNSNFQSGLLALKNQNHVKLERQDSLLSSMASIDGETQNKQITAILGENVAVKFSDAIIDHEAAQRERNQNQKLEDQILDDQEFFEHIKRRYRNDLKYVTGWGQSQDSCILLE